MVSFADILQLIASHTNRICRFPWAGCARRFHGIIRVQVLGCCRLPMANDFCHAAHQQVVSHVKMLCVSPLFHLANDTENIE